MENDQVAVPLIDVESIIPILNKIPLFGGLTDKQLYNLFRKLKKIKYAENQIIFEEGDSSSTIYIIKSGKVKLVKNLYKSPLELFEFGIGQCFGENSFIGIEPHTASAVAVEDTELIIMTGEMLLDFYENDKDLYCMILLNISRELSRRLNQTENILLHYFSE